MPGVRRIAPVVAAGLLCAWPTSWACAQQARGDVAVVIGDSGSTMSIGMAQRISENATTPASAPVSLATFTPNARVAAAPDDVCGGAAFSVSTGSASTVSGADYDGGSVRVVIEPMGGGAAAGRTSFCLSITALPSTGPDQPVRAAVSVAYN